MGVLEMENFWNDLTSRKEKNQLDKREENFLKKLSKIFGLSKDPKHNSLASHEITSLSNSHFIFRYNLLYLIKILMYLYLILKIYNTFQ